MSFKCFKVDEFAARFMAHCNVQDSSDTAVFGRQLEVAIAESYDVKYTQTKWRTIMPSIRMVDPGANVVSYKQYDYRGEADFISDFAADFPQVQLTGAEFFQKFHSLGASYGYSIQEWREAQLAKLPLDAMKARAAREVVERKLEKLAAKGDSLHNMNGFANHASVPIVTKGVTSGLSSDIWLPEGGGTTADPLEVFQDLTFACRKVAEDTRMIHEPDSVLFPTKVFNYLNSTLFQPSYNTKTLMQALREANGWLKNVDTWNRLDDAGADSKGRIVVYKKDGQVCEFMMAQDFETFPPEVKSMSFTINCHARAGGVQIRYPKAMLYLDGAGGTSA